MSFKKPKEKTKQQQQNSQGKKKKLFKNSRVLNSCLLPYGEILQVDAMLDVSVVFSLRRHVKEVCSCVTVCMLCAASAAFQGHHPGDV